ncbi:MAG: ZIP family metal transporter [Oscillospiraceae bacterium]|nr:ZIP family metal transporter [Oscillospiraceae bacterium]
MEILTWVVLVTLIAGIGGTGLGGIVGALLRRDSDKIISLLLSFAGGIMLSVVSFDLIAGAIFPSGTQSKADILLVISGILVGYGAVSLLNTAIDRRINRKPADAARRPDRLLVGGLVMAAAIALHNLPEGMVIGAGYAAGSAAVRTAGSGFLLAVVIGLHNIPEGMAVAVPLLAGGMRPRHAVLLTALTGAPTILGALAGYLLGMAGPISLSMSLSFASGAMLYVVLGELLPESARLWRGKLPALAALLGILLGLVIIYQ